MTRRRVAALALAVLALGGCATAPKPRHGAAEPGACLPPGRSVIVSRVSNEENRGIGEAAAEQLANQFRGASDVLVARELSSEAAVAGLAAWAGDAVWRLQHGGRLTREDSQVLSDRFGIRTLIVADVKVYEQVWGQRAKFTRAGVDALAVDLVADQMLWRRQGDAELEENRGRAFQLAMEQAVQGLADSICPRPSDFSVTKMWRDYHR
jgi:hypothetical protein